MHNLKKVICTMLAVLAVMQAAVLPVCAVEVPASESVETTYPTETMIAYEAATEPAAVNTIATEPTATAPAAEPQLQTEPAVVTETEPAAIAETQAVPEETVESVEAEAPVQDTYTTVPLYFQTDYPDTMYARGTIATSGCSITALAMVATYLTDHEYLPDELAYYFGGQGENNMDRLELASETMQLPYEKPENFHKALAALREGKVVIALMNSRSIFTDSQHFIVLTGFNEDGKIMVHDPNAANYERWDLKNAFQVGFDQGDISCGFCGAWAYDKAAMPEEPFLYEEDRPELGDARYPEIQLSVEEIRLLARVVWVEARGESAEGQQAVAEVVLNRMHDGDFPDTLKGVVYAEGQFRSVAYLDDAEPTQAQYEAIERAIYGPYVLPEGVVHFATYAATNNVWGKIGGHTFCYQSSN